MNEQFQNTVHPEDEKIAQKLSQVAEQTHANPQFAAELEEKLRDTHNRKASPIVSVSPALRWATLMILLAVALSWSIKTLIPAPQPATNNTPAPSETSTPAPDNVETTATTSSEEGGYDFRGAKLYLQQPLPDSPAQAHVYLLKKDEPATEEQARALAERFGIQGEIYTTYNYVFATDDYVISDGRQSLDVYSMRYFTYTADLSKTSRISTNTSNDNAESIIRTFLQTRGFDFQYRITPTDFFGGYVVQPLAPDATPMQYEPFTLPTMLVMLDDNGTVLRVDASLMDFDTTPLGEYGIISAQEAFNKMLDDYTVTGKMESSHSPSQTFQDWFRTYPDNQSVTAYGSVTKFPALDPGKPALLLLDGIPVIGNINGLEGLEDYTFIKAMGQYISDAGIRKFNIESWDRHVQQSSFTGTLSRQGDQTVLTMEDGSGKQYPLLDPPADVPLDTEIGVSQLSVYGVIADGNLDWNFIRYFENVNQSGGGGGGGLGFYQLNLTGTPVAFPTPTLEPSTNEDSTEYIVQENDTLASIALNFGVSVESLRQANGLGEENIVFLGQRLLIPNEPSTENPFTGIYTVQEGDTCAGIAAQFGITVQSIIAQNQLSEECLIYVGQRLSVPIPEPTEQQVQDLRGYLSITIHNKGDGTSTKEYTLDAPEENGSRLYTMEGTMLGELDPYNALPILVSGTIDITGKLIVDSYKIPYPDLQFQIVKGTQSTAQLEGQDVIIFTTEDGQSYVEFLATNQIPLTADSVTGRLGDALQQEVLIIPEETFGGMPVAHVFQSAMIQENGPQMEIQANKIFTYNDSDLPDMGNFTPPNLTITGVELVYFVSNPYYQVNDPNYDQRSPYLQPVWHFHGQYDNGNEFDVLIQALKQEFLLPELVPGLSPG